MKLWLFLQLRLYKHSFKAWLIELLIDRLIDWLIEGLTHLNTETDNLGWFYGPNERANWLEQRNGLAV
jgi:hypothetical protein